MTVLVVTGGIGSGKSLVCRLLHQKYGVPVYDADAKAKEIYGKYPAVVDMMEEVLGKCLRDCDGNFIPRALADVIFNDGSALQEVEKILFPVLKQDFLQWSSEQEVELAVFESATILEKPMFKGFGDFVLLVDAPLQTRLARAAERDAVTPSAIERRAASQPLMNRLSDGGSDPRVGHVIYNSSTLEDLSRNLDEFMENYGLTKML